MTFRIELANAVAGKAYLTPGIGTKSRSAIDRAPAALSGEQAPVCGVAYGGWTPPVLGAASSSLKAGRSGSVTFGTSSA